MPPPTEQEAAPAVPRREAAQPPQPAAAPPAAAAPVAPTETPAQIAQRKLQEEAAEAARKREEARQVTYSYGGVLGKTINKYLLQMKREANPKHAPGRTPTEQAAIELKIQDLTDVTQAGEALWYEDRVDEMCVLYMNKLKQYG